MTHTPLARLPEALVDTEHVARHAKDVDGRPVDDVRIIEIDVDTELYTKGHIPGAIAWNWTTDLNDPVRRDIASAEQVEALLSRAGVTPQTTLVLYGDHNNWFAAFGAWLLNYYGHDNVKLLDGGRRKWETERRPLVAEVPVFNPTQYKITRVRPELRATRDQVLAAATRQERALIDVRSPDEYTGKILAPPGLGETALRGGHIPGAINVPWRKAVNDDGTFKGASDLAQLYAALPRGKDIVTYCRIGERSAHTWFVQKHLLGHANVANYDGSWTEYGNLIAAPIHVGPTP